MASNGEKEYRLGKRIDSRSNKYRKELKSSECSWISSKVVSTSTRV